MDFNARLRAQMLRQAVLQAGDDPTLDTVAAWLPPDFFSADTDEAAANEAELADMIAAIAAEAEPAQEFSADEKVPEAIRDEPAQTPAEPIKEPPTITFAEAQDAVIAWGNKLSAARGRLMAAQSRQQDGRLKLAAAIGQLVNCLPKLSREGLAREYLASEAERRQRVADGLEAPLGARQSPASALTASRQRSRNINQGYGNKHLGKARSLVALQQAAGLKPAIGFPKLPSQR